MIVFTKHKSIRRHTNGSFKGCPISPKCIILLNYPIFPRCTKYFLKNYFQLPIGQFYLATSLWVVCSCNLVSHSIFSQDVIKQLIIEVSNVSFCCSYIVTFRFQTLWVMDINSGKIDEVFEGLFQYWFIWLNNLASS